MEIGEFKNKVNILSNLNNIQLLEEDKESLYKYMELLLEWNEKINLTAITEENEIILKHFIDSAIINKYIDNAKKLVDVGTGAGFPGMVLKIINKDLSIVLLDALNKRINFLNEVLQELDLKNIEAIHGRAEEFGRNEEHRERYDIVTSRAVANMNVLLEYMMPLVKVGGKCICMKSKNAEEEIETSINVITLLGGELEKIEKLYLENEKKEKYEREIIIIRKKCSTPRVYPRKPSKINKKPLF